MKKLVAVLIAVLAFMAIQPDQIEAQQPHYEKYGRMAMAIVNADYPGDPIREYEYLGRSKVNQSDVADTFRFKVEEKGKSFYVRVIITHSLTAAKLLTLKVEPER
ncbi:hypothetical protein DRW41_19085 [Neobacillus piezotolerans]|uniref:DUF3889 domain-containing protein n=1 Tax=Neobacillus piezotolerans TaxID=2259171 RepID=A0A3D8GLA1_9BACI|nr:DUF3889 domain-containing protein [Neobacillus piezotolerans]RDU35224.1 hypothetical protein DRW41_19085 [Neobacillus piezotolerans]